MSKSPKAGEETVSEARGVHKHLDYSACAGPGKAGHRPDPSPVAPSLCELKAAAAFLCLLLGTRSTAGPQGILLTEQMTSRDTEFSPAYIAQFGSFRTHGPKARVRRKVYDLELISQSWWHQREST